MSYKMIVLDLDGTLMSSKNEILPKTKEALFKAQENGVNDCFSIWSSNLWND